MYVGQAQACGLGAGVWRRELSRLLAVGPVVDDRPVAETGQCGDVRLGGLARDGDPRAQFLRLVHEAAPCQVRVDASRDTTHAVVLRSEEHTSELQSLMRISYAVFCLKKNIKTKMTKL